MLFALSISRPYDHGRQHLFRSQQEYIRVGCVTFWAVGLGVRRGKQTCQNLTTEIQHGLLETGSQTDLGYGTKTRAKEGPLEGLCKVCHFFQATGVNRSDGMDPFAAQKAPKSVVLKAVCLIWPTSSKENV